MYGAKRAGILDPIVITPDEIVARFCHARNYAHILYKPPIRSVLHELANAAELENADALIQVTGDCPFVCPRILGMTAEKLRTQRDDFIVFDMPYRGFTCRGVLVEALRAAVAYIEESMEHGTTIFYRVAPAWDCYFEAIMMDSIPRENFSVDTEEDLAWASLVAGITELEDTAEEIIRKCHTIVPGASETSPSALVPPTS